MNSYKPIKYEHINRKSKESILTGQLIHEIQRAKKHMIRCLILKTKKFKMRYHFFSYQGGKEWKDL